MRLVPAPGNRLAFRAMTLSAPFDLHWKRGHWRGGIIAMVRPRPRQTPKQQGIARDWPIR